MAKDRAQKINELRELIEEWEDTGAMLPGSDVVNKIQAIRKRAMAERFDPAVNRLGPSGMSPSDMARLNNSYANLIEEATTYLIGLGDQQVEGNKLRQLTAESVFSTARAGIQARAKVLPSAMSQERMAINDMFDGAKAGVELMSTGLKGAGSASGDTAAEVMNTYEMKKASTYNRLIRHAEAEETQEQLALLNSLTPKELDEFLVKFTGPGADATRLDLTIGQLTGYNTIDEAKDNLIVQDAPGVIGTMSLADQAVINRVENNEMAVGDSTVGVTDASILDEYVQNNIMPEGVSVVDSNELAAKLMGFYAVYDPNRLTRMYMDGSRDRMGLIKYLRQTGQFDLGKDIVAAISAANRGDYVSLPDLLDALVGNYDLSDDQRSTNDRIASNIALTQEAALGPKAGMQVNPQTQAWYDLADDPMVTGVMSATGKSLKQTMNAMVRQSRRQAAVEKKIANYDFNEQKRAAFEAAKKVSGEGGGPGVYRKDWLARTIQDMHTDEQDRVNQAINSGLGSAAVVGDNPNESLETGREQENAGQTPGE